LIGRLFRRLLGREETSDVPDTLWQEGVASLPFLARLPAADLERLRDLVTRFLASREFTAAGGLVLDDRMRLSIALQGCLPILNLGLDWYRDWIGIVVYPAEFVIPRQIVDEDGVVHVYDEVASGEAWGGGPLLVSWQDVEMAGDGYNVVIHEFAHKLDMANGDADGVPPLHAGMSRAAWLEAFDAAYDDFCARVDAADDPELLAIDPYAAESPGEFFAVLSELFFEAPELVEREYPAVYRQLSLFYRSDPLATPN